ncbi:MAG: glutamate racemase [Sandaracinaceae bacterium]
MTLGVLDWGVGGLDLHRRLIEAGLDHNDAIYLSDAGSPPYGTLSEDELARRVAACVTSLIHHGCAPVVIGCNAASSVLSHPLVRDAAGEVPVRGVIAPALAATLAADPSEVTVLGGARTVASDVYAAPLRAAGLKVRQHVGQPLSAAVEAGVVEGPALDAVLDPLLAPIRDTSFLVLACTHYPAVAGPICARLPRLERIVNPAEETARALAQAWSPFDGAARPLRYWTTGDPDAARLAARAAFGVEALFSRAPEVPSGTRPPPCLRGPH